MKFTFKIKKNKNNIVGIDEPVDFQFNESTGKKHGFNLAVVLKIIFALIVLSAIGLMIMLNLMKDKATQLYKNNLEMAESIYKVSRMLDKGSGTKVAGQLTTDKLSDNKNVGNLLPVFLRQAEDIVKQRNMLAATLKEGAEKLMLPDEFNESEFQNLKSTKNTTDLLLKNFNKINLRNDELIANVIDTAAIVDCNIDSGKLKRDNKNLNTITPVLTSVTDTVKKLKNEIVTTNEELAKKNTELEKLRKASTGDAAKNVVILKETVTRQQSELAKLKLENNSLKQNLNVKDKPVSSTANEKVSKQKNIYPELYYELKGKVVDYNSKWGFIIIDLGQNNRISAEVDGVKKTVNVPIPTDKELYISRGDKFIGKGKIVNVYSRYSVANIIFPTADNIELGDKVFFPKEEVKNKTDIPKVNKIPGKDKIDHN